MKHILLSFASLLSLQGIALAQSPLVFFEAEEQNYVQLSTHPQAEVLLYSTQQGGTELTKALANADGIVREQFDLNKTPAFVLDKKTPTNPLGTNHVFFLDTKEFVLSNIYKTIANDVCTIHFDAEAPTSSNIDYRVVKYNAKGTASIIKELPSFSEQQHYTVHDAYEAGTVYKLEVVKDKRIVRYASKPIGLQVQTEVAFLYPNPCNQELQVALSVAGVHKYVVYDMKGQALLHGNCDKNKNVLNVSSLASGVYSLQLRNESGQQSLWFTKQ